MTGRCGEPCGTAFSTGWPCARDARPMNQPLPPTAQRYRLSPLLRASLLLHGGAALATLLRPHWWPWTLGAVIADQLLLTALGLWPRSGGLGSNWTRLPAAA